MPEIYYAEQPDGTMAEVTVIRVKASQLPAPPPDRDLRPDMADRLNYGNGKWTIYLSEDAGPEVLEWELEQIRQGTTWDKI